MPQIFSLTLKFKRIFMLLRLGFLKTLALCVLNNLFILLNNSIKVF